MKVVTVAASLFAVGLVSAAEAPLGVPVYVNGSLVGFGIMKGGRAYLPVRAISDALGARVQFNGDSIDISAEWMQNDQSATSAPPTISQKYIPLGESGWHWCENGVGAFRVRNVLIAGITLSCELDVTVKPWKDSSDQVGHTSVGHFTVNFYNDDFELIGREDATVPNMFNEPGRYTLKATSIYLDGRTKYVTVTYKRATYTVRDK